MYMYVLLLHVKFVCNLCRKLSQNIGKLINTNYNLLDLKAYDNNKNGVFIHFKIECETLISQFPIQCY